MPVVSPRWLHDGSGVIVHINAQADGRQTSAFHFVDVRTGTFRRLFDRDANGRGRTTVGTVSPDDKTFYLGVRNDPAGPITGIVGVDLATGVEGPVLTFPGAGLPGGIGLAVSPDGSTLAVMVRERAITDTETDESSPSGSTDRTIERCSASWPLGLDICGQDAVDTRWADHRLRDFDANRNWRLMRVPAEGGKAEFDGLDFDTLAPRLSGIRMVPEFSTST